MAKQKSTLHSLKWSALGHISPQIVSPLIFIFIARLLSPETFGLIAIAMIVISFLQMILSSGFTNALIQKQGSKKEIYKAADFIFCFNLFLSAICYLIIFWSASGIAAFFHNPEAKRVVSILSISLIITAAGNVQLAMLQKDMQFKSIFLRQIAPIGSHLLITLPLAYLGYGVWALVAGKLSSDTVSAIILWTKSEWKPRPNINFKENIGLIKFGLYVMGTSLIAWSLTQGDNLLVGKFLTIKELGLYKTGYDFDQKMLGILVVPILPVFYSKFCSFRTKDEMKEYYLKIKEYLSMLVFPLMGGVILISPYFENLILGEKWKGISFVMALLSITGISNLWALAGSMYNALGKPEISTKISFIIVCSYIPLWLFFIQFGLTTFLVARIFIASISVTLCTYFENRELKINIFRSVKFYHKAFFASMGMVFTGFSFQYLFFQNNYNFIALILLILLSITTYVLLISILAREQVDILKELLKRLYKS